MVFVPLLIVLLNWNIHLAIGTSLAAIVPTACVAAFRHFRENSVNLKIAAVLALLAIVGAWLGAGISLKTDVVVLRKVFAVFLLILAARLYFTP